MLIIETIAWIIGIPFIIFIFYVAGLGVRAIFKIDQNGDSFSQNAYTVFLGLVAIIILGVIIQLFGWDGEINHKMTPD